jgi:hypothetical protein
MRLQDRLLHLITFLPSVPSHITKDWHHQGLLGAILHPLLWMARGLVKAFAAWHDSGTTCPGKAFSSNA